MKDVTLKQGMKFWQLIDEKGTPCEQLQKLLGSGLLSDLLDGNIDQVDRDAFRKILGLNPLIAPCNIAAYPVSVNYNRSVKESRKAGNYDWENSDIIEKNFLSEENGTADINVELFHFGKDMDTKDVLAEMDKQGYGPATLKELLALGEKHPDLKREFPVIALGSVWQRPDGNRYCPFLSGGGSGRILGLRWLDGRWGGFCRFAAVRK